MWYTKNTGEIYMNNNRRGLLVGFTKWQTTVAYPMIKKFFNENNIDLVFEILKKGSQKANTFAEKTLKSSAYWRF